MARRSPPVDPKGPTSQTGKQAISACMVLFAYLTVGACLWDDHLKKKAFYQESQVQQWQSESDGTANLTATTLQSTGSWHDSGLSLTDSVDRRATVSGSSVTMPPPPASDEHNRHISLANAEIADIGTTVVLLEAVMVRLTYHAPKTLSCATSSSIPLQDLPVCSAPR
jgi:hypothetical protein